VVLPRDPKADALDSMLFEGCLLLAPTAKTTHPSAICGELKLRDAQMPWTYRVVRPASHRLDRAYLFGAKGWVQFSQLQPQSSSAAAETPPQHTAPRQRGG